MEAQINLSVSEKLIQKIEDFLSQQSIVVDKKIELFDTKHEVLCNDKKVHMVKPCLRVYLDVSHEEGSLVHVEGWFPLTWNGVFFGVGNGGLGAVVPTCDLAEFVDLNFAAVSADLGTSKGEDSGINNPVVFRDYGYRATHTLTVLGKQLTELVYGKKPLCNLFFGGSTGGQQALCMAQRCPSEYDAIMCGCPGNNRVGVHTYFLWNFVKAKEQDGTPLFDEATCRKITEEAICFYHDLGEGSPDEPFVNSIRCDEKTITAFVDRVSQKLSLSDKQKAALLFIYKGPVHAKTQQQIFGGMSIGTELSGLLPALNDARPAGDYIFKWAFGKDFDPFSFDFGNDYDELKKRLSSYLDATDTDLRPFFARGNKLILLGSYGDSAVPYQDLYCYTKKMIEKLDEEVIKNQLVYYIVPGLDHRVADYRHELVTSEDGKDYRDVLAEWVLENKRPGKILARIRGYGEEKDYLRTYAPIDLAKDEQAGFPEEMDEAYL